MDHGTETAWRTWTAPECLFQIEYSLQALEEIRLAVVDAFFSLPRGGAEIGGILLGKQEGTRISIVDYEALDCEHAMGPSFTLSPRDQNQLSEMTARARRNPPNRQPVGWYHSHTRSEIFLSETDQDIHKRFFPEPWQIALVLKPHTFEPTRGGFFFREPDGSMRGAATYQEFVLDPQPLRAPAGNHAPMRPAREEAPPVLPPPFEPHAEDNGKPKGRIPITREIAIEPLYGEGKDSADGEGSPPFVQFKQESSWRPIKAAALLALGLAAGGVGYQTRDSWLPQVMSKVRSVLPKEPDSYLSLRVSDDRGQLKIQWDPNASGIRNALEGTLEISDGKTAPQAVRLDGAHLATGSFVYARQNERVDITMIASEPSGQQVKEQTSFLGRLPGENGGADDPDGRKARQTESDKVDKLQKDLNFQAAKNRKLEKDLKDMRDELDQKRRLDNQAPPPEKKNN